MRISRLAREYDLSIQALTSYLETLEPPLKSVHPNAKLEEEIISKVLAHFEIPHTEEEVDTLPPVQEQIQNEASDDQEELTSTEPIQPTENVEQNTPSIPATPEEEIALLEGDLEPPPEQIQESPSQEESFEEEPAHQPISEEEVILSDQLIEMIEGEDLPEELEKIKLIKAPKKKLTGLKVLDKIEIPEDPRKKSKEQEEAEKAARPQLSPEEKAERVRKREAYKEKRRLEAKQKQEANEARKAKREKEKEANRVKAIKEKHYKAQLSKQQPERAKSKIKKEATMSQTSKTSAASRPQPKSLLGKFWRWLNT